jgi:hypothetical protein
MAHFTLRRTLTNFQWVNKITELLFNWQREGLQTLSYKIISNSCTFKIGLILIINKFVG